MELNFCLDGQPLQDHIMDQTCLLAYLEEMEPAMEDSLISTPYATDREIGAEQHPSESFQVQPVDAGTAEHCLPACASRHQLCPDWLAACCTDVIPVGQTPYAAAAAAAATPTPWAAQDSSVRGWLHSSYTQAGVSSALHCSSLAAAATAPWGAEPLACAAAVAGSGCTVECCTTGGADSSSHGDPACSEDTVVAAAVVAAAAAAAAAGCSQAGDAATTTAAHMPQTASEARRAAHAREKRREAFTVSQRQLQKKKQDEVVKLQDEINCITAKNNQLQGRVQALGSDHSSLLSRLVDVTGKWQATVVDNAQLHQENGQLRLQLAQLQQQLALVQQQMQHVLGQAQQLQTHPW